MKKVFVLFKHTAFPTFPLLPFPGFRLTNALKLVPVIDVTKPRFTYRGFEFSRLVYGDLFFKSLYSELFHEERKYL